MSVPLKIPQYLVRWLFAPERVVVLGGGGSTNALAVVGGSWCPGSCASAPLRASCFARNIPDGLASPAGPASPASPEGDLGLSRREAGVSRSCLFRVSWGFSRWTSHTAVRRRLRGWSRGRPTFSRITRTLNQPILFTSFPAWNPDHFRNH